MKGQLRRSISLLLIVLVLCLASADAQKRKPRVKPIVATVTVRAPAEKPLPIDAQRRENAFDKAWDTINLFYYDQTFGGVGWSKIYTEFKPRVRAAKTDVEFHRILADMVGRLGRSHLGIIPPEYFSALNDAKRAARLRERADPSNQAEVPATTDPEEYGDDEIDDLDTPSMRYGIGVEIRIIDGKVVITKVEEQSGAAIAGLRRGFVIDQINGVSLKDLITRIVLMNPSRRTVDQYLPVQITGFFLNGEADTTVNLSCFDERDELREYKVPRLVLTGQAVSFGPNYPEQFLQFEAKGLNDDVGYVRFNLFGIPVIEKFCDALTAFRGKKGVIIDLRGNTGGIIATIVGLTGMVTDRQVPIGTSVYRRGQEKIAARSLTRHFEGKLVLLVDGQSMSSAELFAAALKDNNRAVVVGERTAGEALPAGSIRLETGAVLVYPVANFLTPRGQSLEGTGLEPHINVPLTRKSMFGGGDPQLEKAVDLITRGDAYGTLLVQTTQLAPRPGGMVAGSSGDVLTPPPPPPRISSKIEAPRELKLTRLGAVDNKPEGPAVKDEAALAAISSFAERITANGRTISSYEAEGTGALGIDGGQGKVEVTAFRDSGKFALLLRSEAAGLVRTIYNGKTIASQTEYGMDAEVPYENDVERAEIFAPLFFAADPKRFGSLKFEGQHELDGRKVNVVSGVTTDGLAAAMSFDAGTKLLSTFTLGGLMYTLSDYRSLDGIMVPFDLNLDHIMHLKLSTVKLNGKVDAAHFEKKERCFDKPY